MRLPAGFVLACAVVLACESGTKMSGLRADAAFTGFSIPDAGSLGGLDAGLPGDTATSPDGARPEVAPLLDGSADSAVDVGSGSVLPAQDAGAPPGPDAASGASLRLTSGRYRITGFTPGYDECQLAPGSLAAAMTVFPVLVDASGTVSVGDPKGTPPIASLGQGPLDRTPGARSVLARRNQVLGEAGACAYGSEVISVLSLVADDAFDLSIIERQVNRRNCEPPGVGTQCNSMWSWRLTRIP